MSRKTEKVRIREGTRVGRKAWFLDFLGHKDMNRHLEGSVSLGWWYVVCFSTAFGCSKASGYP